MTTAHQPETFDGLAFMRDSIAAPIRKSRSAWFGLCALRLPPASTVFTAAATEQTAAACKAQGGHNDRMGKTFGTVGIAGAREHCAHQSNQTHLRLIPFAA